MKVYEVIETNARIYIITEYLSGGQLFEKLINSERMTERLAARYLSDIILALNYCHRNNIIHRDIKPENLVLDSKGYLRLTDLGIARIQKPENHQDTSGTPGYMAPEVMCR